MISMVSSVFLAAPSGRSQTGSHAERPVPPVPGLSDEGPVCLPALLHPMLHAQRQKAAAGKRGGLRSTRRSR